LQRFAFRKGVVNQTNLATTTTRQLGMAEVGTRESGMGSFAFVHHAGDPATAHSA